MEFRRPPNWSNIPYRNPQSRSYIQLSQTPRNEAHYSSYDSIEEEIGEYEPMQANAYGYGSEYESDQPQALGHFEGGFDQDEIPEYISHESRNYRAQVNDAYDRDEDEFDRGHDYQFEPIEKQEDSRGRSGYIASQNASNYHCELGPAEQVARKGTQLAPVSRLRNDKADLYRGIFKKFGVFNAVQSACFDDIMNTNGNMVISAPTGSGKTVLFELAIIRSHMNGTSGGKCVYIAPTKALCAEKFNDWSAKFEPLGLKCYELTGDTTMSGLGLWAETKAASIIITTGEKWDSVTRSWKNHQETLDCIRLFLVDEVHVLGESRGSTLEVVVSRMKLRGKATRFILVSATIPNIDDIAAWISSKEHSRPAKVMQFGEEYRPCKLTRHVVDVLRRKDWSSFQFEKSLDAKLYSVIEMYTAGKPILIFVSTRKGVFSTADLLAKCYEGAESKRAKVPWSRPTRIDALFRDKRLGNLAAIGIGVHHAGLDIEDRKTTERLYIQKHLRVLVATSTLAVGVNLPAHFVIIKGVHLWQNGMCSEYSDLDIMQMLGRAGRPQFDTEGVAVIMCEQDLVAKYQALTQGTRVLESYLHHNLSEHLNSEIGLGTITDVESAKSWLRGSFLYQRVRKNHNHYAIGAGDESLSWQERMDSIVTSNIERLQNNQLVKEINDGGSRSLISTDFGEIMSKFYIRQTTMVEIIASQKCSTLRELLELISRCDEFSENKIRQTERTVCNVLRKDPEIRFEMKKIETTADKVFVLLQAALGGIPLNAAEYKTHDCQLFMEEASIFRHVNRLSRAIVEVAIVNKDGRQLKNGLELVRCLAAKAWEDRPIVLRQIVHLGPKSIKILAENGITNFEKLRSQDPLHIESLLKRGNGFGYDVVASAEAIPRYNLNVQEVRVRGGKNGVEVDLSITCGSESVKNTRQGKKSYDMTSILTISSAYDLLDFRRIQTKALLKPKTFDITASLTKPSQSVLIIIASETVAGSVLQVAYKPKISSSKFPVPLTRPPTSTENDLEGLEDDPDFWKMGIDESSEDLPRLGPILHPERKDARATVVPTRDQKKDNDNARTHKLPNGNYECNHGCLDKSTCRHLCCRQGLPGPPVQSKRSEGKEPALTATGKANPRTGVNEKKPISSIKRLHKISSSAAKDVKKLEDLQRHHQNASVSESLCIPAGQRLKLGLPAPTTMEKKKKAKQEPSYDLSFADLGDSSVTKSGDLATDNELSDDDELPKNVTAYLAWEKNNLPKAKSQPSQVLKRRISTISLSSDDEVQPPPAAQPSKRPRESLVDEHSEPEEYGAHLFLPSDDVYIPAVDPYTAPDLMTDIEEYLLLGPTIESKGQGSETDAKEIRQLVAPESSNTLGSMAESNQDLSNDVEEEDDELADLEAWLSGKDLVYV